MIVDALRFLQEKIDGARMARKIEDKQAFLNESAYEVGGEIRTFGHARPVRCDYVNRIEDLAAFSHGESATWIDLKEIVLCVDEEHYRRSVVTMPLVKTSLYGCVSTPLKQMQHVDFVTQLRTSFGPLLDKDYPNLIAKLKTMRVNIAGHTESTSGQGQSAYGNSIARKAAGADELEPLLTFRVPIYKHHPYEVEISADLVVHTEGERVMFSYLPRPASIEAAEQQALDLLLLDTTAHCQGHVYLGTPGVGDERPF